MSTKRLNEAELADEAKRWGPDKAPEAGWVSAPEAVPRHAETEAISLRVPKAMLGILKEFAAREGVGYQVLMKRWLDERIRSEAVAFHAKRQKVAPAEAKVTARPATAKASARTRQAK
jgi:hypothetical protein